MARTVNNYVLGLRWETRLVISFLVATFAALPAMLNVEVVVSRIILATLVVFGSGLALALRSLLRDDYLHTSTSSTLVSLLPPVTPATVYVGLISSWMQRVGFGVFMRVAVTSTLLWSVIAAGLQLTTTQSAVVLAASVATSAARQLLGSSRYLLPWLLLIVGFSISSIVFP